MGKRIIICCDGTGNQLNEKYSNVVKLYMCLKKDQSQLTFYDPGVGTMSEPGLVTPLYKWLSKWGGLAFGWGLRSNVSEAYSFLMEYYDDGDDIYIFGFSRGAYTARVLAGMINAVGLLSKGSDHLFPYAWNAYKRFNKNGGAKIARTFRKTYGRKVPIFFVGLWDTVTSIGLFGLRTKPFTTTNESIRTLRHAISIDERRSYYRQNLFKAMDGQNVKQVWFAGVHSDVGGSYDLKESGLAQVSLQWMMDEAGQFFVAFDSSVVAKILEDKKELHHSLPSATGKLHRSMTVWWWPLELVPKIRRKFPWIGWPNLWRRRRTNCDSMGNPLVPTIHWSVERRMKDMPDYAPSNLQSPYNIEKKRETAKEPVSLG